MRFKGRLRGELLENKMSQKKTKTPLRLLGHNSEAPGERCLEGMQHGRRAQGGGGVHPFFFLKIGPVQLYWSQDIWIQPQGVVRMLQLYNPPPAPGTHPAQPHIKSGPCSGAGTHQV